MLRTNSRPLFLLLLILLFIVAPVLAAPGPDLTATLTHTGNTGTGNVDYVTNSTNGTVTVVVQNVGDTDTTGNTDVVINLAGGLISAGIVANSTPNGYFTSCTSGTSTVTCSTATVIQAADVETFSIKVTAPAVAAAGPFTNSVTVSNASDVNNANDTVNDAATFKIVTAAVDMTITGLSHNGNSGSNFIVNTNTGRVTVVVQNIGTITSSGQIVVTVSLQGGLTYNALVSSALFTCSGSGSIVTCTTNATIAPSTGDTIIFTVNSPNTPNGSFTNTAFIFGGNDGNLGNNTATDPTAFSVVVAAGTLTPTSTTTVTPLPTFPIPTFTVVPTLPPPTVIPTSTLIPPPATRTPPPRPANAGQAIGPIPTANVTVVVDRDGVNVRLIPAIGAEVIATVNAGFSTNILARSPDNQWVQILLDGELGWIGTPVLAIVSGDINTAPVADPRTIPYGGFDNPRAGLSSVTSATTGKLQISGLRVRGGPSRSYPVLANAPRYTIFSLLGRTADNLWLQVSFEGTLGWVATQFVELQQGLGVLQALPIDGIVADSPPLSDSGADTYTDTLKLMLSRVELAQPSLDSIRATWTNIALGNRAQCGSYPARPTDFNIPNPVLAPFYATLYPINSDFNSAMTSLRLAIDLFIDICSRPQPAEGFVGQAVVQNALDAINQTDSLFASVRQRINALLPPEGPIDNDKECLFTFQNRSQVVPRLKVNEPQLLHLTAHNFVLGFCFDGGAGQSLSIQALKALGNASPRLTVSSFDNATNFIGSAAFDAATTTVSIQPILITQTGRYILIIADLDGAANAPLDGTLAIMLTDLTGNSGTGATLALDTNGNVVVNQGGAITPATPGVSTPGTFSLVLTPGVGGVPTPTATRFAG